ncbi:unnamed protein product [Urochloa humidicola]
MDVDATSELPTSHAPAASAIDTGNDNVPDANKSGSSTHEKKNRKKRAAINLKMHVNQGVRVAKRLKLEPEARKAYNRYLSKRTLKKPRVERHAHGNTIEQKLFLLEYSKKTFPSGHGYIHKTTPTKTICMIVDYTLCSTWSPGMARWMLDHSSCK